MLPARQTVDVVRIGDFDTEWAVFVHRRQYNIAIEQSELDYFPTALKLVEEGWTAVCGTEVDNLFVHIPEPKHLTLLKLKLSEDFVFKQKHIGGVPIWMYHSYLEHLIDKGLVDPSVRPHYVRK